MSEFDVHVMLENAIEHYNNGRTQEAVQLSKKILKISPNDPDALNLLGIMAFQMGQLDTAIKLIQQAIRNDPNRPSFLNNLGNVLVEQNRIEEALKINNAYIHVYGKQTSNTERKMGHVTALGSSINEAEKVASKAASLIYFGEKS